MKKWKIMVVPHTHWDKEWYFTKQDSDVILCSNIEQYLTLYQANKNCFSFTYDGQTSIIDDYLTYHSHEVNSLLWESLAKKKLIIGPWYTQPDLFNSTSESIVRNLLLGINVAKRYRADYLRVGYVPDSFGHNGQMPQIFQQFGLEHFVYWRGAHSNDLLNSVVHWWEGIDGTKILAYNFYFGYWVMGSFFPYQNLTLTNLRKQAKNFLQNFTDILNTLKQKLGGVTNNLLIPFGGDQAPVTKLLQEFINELNDVDNEHEWILSDYDQYFATTKFNRLVTVNGELKTPAFARIHKTIASQRVDLKIKTKQLEYNLYNKLEPLATFFYLQTNVYQHEIIERVLKLLTTSQAHDSLGGCNSDMTNADIKNRLAQANDLVESLTTKLLKVMAHQFQLSDEEFIIFNPQLNACQVKNNFEVTLFSKKQYFEIIDQNQQPVNFIVTKQKHHQGGQNVIATKNGEINVALDSFFETKIIMLDLKISLFTFAKFKLVTTNSKNNCLQPSKEIKTKRWEIKINQNGTLDIYDQKFQIHYQNQFLLVADHDCGDSYDYSPSKNNSLSINEFVTSTAEINTQQDYYFLTLENKYLVSVKENNKKQEQTFRLDFEINNTDEIKVKIKTKNIGTEIRWRIKNEIPFLTTHSYANQAYSTIQRPTQLTADLKVWQHEHWKEKPVAIETNESFVYLQHNKIKTGYLTCGNNEYEVTNQAKGVALWITLFRSVPVLGRDELINRPGRASGVSEITVFTNDARLLTDLSFQMVWFSTTNQEIWNRAEIMNTPTIFYQNQKLNSIFHHADHFLIADLNTFTFKKQKQVLPFFNYDNFTIKAIKKHETRQTIVVRGFNNSDNNIVLNFAKIANANVQVNVLNLLEDVIVENITADTLTKYQIRTYEIIIKKEGN
ncbi:glycosyl hydrolase-related protein [Spiroplasma sp. SV19]|uniref:glycoside hydrolase family 38 N-terminal domain-containing protein n=1 Tax=Spiroplasma sp. SV19 TaxID=2570468 RepID=UPI0024B7E5F2|nr:glycosyl hydrolase-related protein [Spiroplasma sp. SV19]WHQ37244.1 alpha-mannosidase [Spiroplasma sp. SV19]